MGGLLPIQRRLARDLQSKIREADRGYQEDEMSRLDAAETLLDRKWAISFREGDLALKGRIRSKAKSTINQRPSGVKMFATLCRLIDVKSPSMVHTLVTKFCSWGPVRTIDNLVEEMGEWEIALEHLEDMGVTISSGQKVGSLECMLGSLKEKHVFLAGDLRQILKQDVEDFQGYWDTLEDFVEEMEAKRTADSWGNIPEANSVQVDRKTRPCIAFRETGTCGKGSACSWAHIKGTKECDNEAFKDRGFCSAWQTCLGRHPDAMRKGSVEHQAKMAKKRAKQAKSKAEGSTAAGAADATGEAQSLEEIRDCDSSRSSDSDEYNDDSEGLLSDQSQGDDQQQWQPGAENGYETVSDDAGSESDGSSNVSDDTVSDTDTEGDTQVTALTEGEEAWQHVLTGAMEALQVSAPRRSTRVRKLTAPKVFDDLMEEGTPPRGI